MIRKALDPILGPLLGPIMAAILVALSAGAVQAADFQYNRYNRQAPYTVNMYSWAGPYIGGNLGYGWGRVSNNPADPSGLVGGVQAGFNWRQAGPWVFGLEADIQASGANDTFAPWKFSNPWFGTARGRIGYAFDNVLFYGTGGLAFGELKGQRWGLSESRTGFGWTVGLGAEFALTQNWSAKAEYLYVSLAQHDFTVTGLPNGYQFGVIRVGVNYHF